MDRKTVVRTEVKDADKGLVDLVFAKFNVVDHDGDVTVPGAFENGAKTPISAYGHTSWEGKLPVGVGTIVVKSTEAWATAQFFLDTPEGASTFTTVKRLAEAKLGEWSYGYKAMKFDFGDFDGQHVRFLRKQRVDEISPVLLGAGIGTRTVSAKGRKPGDGGGPDGGRSERVYKGIIRGHETDTVDGMWSPADSFAQLGLTASSEELRKAHAWHDPDGDPEHKAAYHFLHHDAAGAANIRACLLGIAGLNGAKGSPEVPDDVRADVYEHLAGHLRDADAFVPDLRSGDGQVKMYDEAIVHLAEWTEFLGRVHEVGSSRRMKGKASQTTAMQTVLRWTDEVVREVKAAIEDPNAGMDEIRLALIRDRLKNGT